MIHFECDQGSEEWKQARLGIPTASMFTKILTPATLKLSKQAASYRMRCLGEWLSGMSDEEFTGDWMARGFLMQPEATKWYEAQQEVEIEPVGFCYLDSSKMVGASPDGFVGDDGDLEIKCPSQAVHMETLVTGKVPKKYMPQVQGQLWVTAREWADFVSYHPDLPSTIIRVKRDEDYIGSLRVAVEEFVVDLLKDRLTLEERGFQPADREAAA